MATDQEYVSFADSFNSIKSWDDSPIEVMVEEYHPKDVSIRKSKSSPLHRAFEIFVDFPLQKMIGSNSQINPNPYHQDADSMDSDHSTENDPKRGGRKWHKLRNSVQRKIQEEKKQILSIGHRRSGYNKNAKGSYIGDGSAINAAIDFHLQAEDEEILFQHIPLIQSNSTSSSSASIDGWTDESRQDSNENNYRGYYDEERCIDDVVEDDLFPIEEEEPADLASSSEEVVSPSKPSRQSDNDSTKRFSPQKKLFHHRSPPAKVTMILRGDSVAKAFVRSSKVPSLRWTMPSRRRRSSRARSMPHPSSSGSCARSSSNGLWRTPSSTLSSTARMPPLRGRTSSSAD